MAILFMDGWDHYGTGADVFARWDGGNSSSTGIGLTTGRTGSGQALRLTRPVAQVWIQRQLHPTTNYGTLIVGMWIRLTAFTNGDRTLVYFMDGNFATNQGNLAYSTTGLLEVNRGPGAGNNLARAGQLTINTWHHVEIKYTCHDSAGAAIVKLDGTEVINISGVDTSQNGAATMDGILIPGANADPSPNTKDFDDLFVLDTSGPAPLNDFIGMASVTALVPDGAGAVTGWTPNTGSNFQAVDEIGQDGDTTYVAASVAGTKDLYTFGDLGASDTPLAVEVLAVVKKDDATVRTVAPTLRSGATDVDGSTVTLTTTYDYAELYRDTDPDTSAAWTKAGVDALQAGVKVVS